MPREFLWAVAAIAVLLAGGTWAAYAVWLELRGLRAEQARLADDQRAMRLQLGNLLGMLLRAGFKRAPTIGWSDDDSGTRVKGLEDLTKFDWRAPID